MAIENSAFLDKTLGRFEEAVEMLQRAISIEPLDADNYYNLAITFNRAGRPDDAIEAAKKSLQISPDYAAAHVAMAVAYLSLSRRGRSQRRKKNAFAFCRAGERVHQ